MFEVKPFGDWDGIAAKLSNASKMFAGAAERAIMQEAHRIRTLIVRNLQTGGTLAGKPFAPHAGMTFILRKFTGRKGGTKPLMSTIGLGAIVVLRQGKQVFVGARSSKQKWRDPKTHEMGATYNTTERQRRFLKAALLASGLPPVNIYVLKIPARPFVGPVIEKFATPEIVEANIRKNISAELGGLFG